jgi:DNA-binding MarR family transcriptional regulator
MSRRYRDIASFDKLIHQPSRLSIMAVLYSCESADFVYLKNATGLTKGNLSGHLSRLEEAGYIGIEKGFKGKFPHTTCRLTDKGRKAFADYWAKWQGLAQKIGS